MLLFTGCNSVEWDKLKVQTIDFDEKIVVVQCPIPEVPEVYRPIIQDYVNTGQNLLSVLILINEYREYGKTGNK